MSNIQLTVSRAFRRLGGHAYQHYHTPLIRGGSTYTFRRKIVVIFIQLLTTPTHAQGIFKADEWYSYRTDRNTQSKLLEGGINYL